MVRKGIFTSTFANADVGKCVFLAVEYAPGICPNGEKWRAIRQSASGQEWRFFGLTPIAALEGLLATAVRYEHADHVEKITEAIRELATREIAIAGNA